MSGGDSSDGGRDFIISRKLRDYWRRGKPQRIRQARPEVKPLRAVRFRGQKEEKPCARQGK